MRTKEDEGGAVFCTQTEQLQQQPQGHLAQTFKTCAEAKAHPTRHDDRPAGDRRLCTLLLERLRHIVKWVRAVGSHTSVAPPSAVRRSTGWSSTSTTVNASRCQGHRGRPSGVR
ncbi:unnamed protein product [Soboliphyme baturini]|uniref:Uncharacterized protein n=1 Tax=Soboliphyme baturini TaxID=241478 RepID=A0A183IZH7_9BILA|nr:unnamed protein product [Soboliphyme baturini]